MRMQAKISASNDCLWFPQVIDRNLPASANSKRKAFIVRVRAGIIKPKIVSPHPVPNTFTKVTTCAAFEVINKPSKNDSVPKKVDCSMLAVQFVIQKITAR